MKEKHEKALKQFAENLIRIRESKGLNKTQLAGLSKVQRAKISKIESCKVNLAITTLFDLAKGLRVHPKKLLDFEIDDH